MVTGFGGGSYLEEAEGDDDQIGNNREEGVHWEYHSGSCVFILFIVLMSVQVNELRIKVI